MPTFYERHEIILCNDISRKLSGKVTITGPGCFSADVVYRNISMPQISPGEIIAIMDSGAYFTSWESSFGFFRPAIVSVIDGRHRIIREREKFENMISLDKF
jgi:diaminopimelate decarboxylase